jgi:hypothetical protein
VNPSYDSSQRYARLIERAELYFERVLREDPRRRGAQSMRQWLNDLKTTRTQELVENTAAWLEASQQFADEQLNGPDDGDEIEVPS